MPPEASTCNACGAAIAVDELADGFAVKVGGRLLCPLCVERLPRDTRALVNRMRALHGLAAQTFRVDSLRHPRLALFTFTTSDRLLDHRRRLRQGQAFDTPPLPPPDRRPRLPTAAEAGRGSRLGWLATAAAAGALAAVATWAVLPGRGPAAPPPPPAAAPAPPPAEAAPPPVPPMTALAQQLTGLETRLRERPAEAAAIAYAGERLRDAVPPGENALRRRAQALVDEARLLAVRRVEPAPPAPPPLRTDPPPAPAPAPPAPAQEPVAVVPPAAAPAAVPPVAPPAVPASAALMPADPVPAPSAAAADPPAAPARPAAAAPDAPVRWAPRIFWPEGHKPLLSPESPAVPPNRLVPWPWPAGEALYEAVPDRRGRTRRLAIELQFTVAGPDGGATVVIHPQRAERTALAAIWTDGAAPEVRVELPLAAGLRWQAVAIPASGTQGMDRARLRLRLEDVKDLPVERPFLVGGATMRAASAPLPADCPPRLPIIDPADCVGRSGRPLGELEFKDLVLRLGGARIRDRRYTVANAKVLLHDVEQRRQELFRRRLRAHLEALVAEVRRQPFGMPNGNPADLPLGEAGFADPAQGWPKAGMGDLGEFDAVVLGWCAGGPADLSAQVDAVIGKMLTPLPRAKREACLPILAIGEIERAKPDEAAALSARWEGISRAMMLRGVAVIDLRPAQAEESADLVREAAARLLADGLRQLDWLLRR